MSRPPTVAVLVAAGSGARLGRAVPKAFIEVAGAPLVIHAAGALVASPLVDGLVVVVSEGAEARARDVLVAGGFDPEAVVAGGAERHESVANGLAALGTDAAVVAVHDAARPLVSPGLVTRTIQALEEPWDAVAPAVPVVDTLKLVEAGGRVVRTVDRSGLWAVQTPQVFPRDVLVEAHARDRAGATDDLALVERAGGRVRVVEGERYNVKVTYAEDLDLVAALLAWRGRG